MVIKDFYCTTCEMVTEDIQVESADISALSIFCEGCKEETAHRTLCNGGIKSRWRENDFPDDPSFYRGQCSHECSIRPLDGKGEVRDLKTGELMADKINNSDKKAERMQRRYFKTDKKRGKLPLTFDQKSKAN